jgi:hypothetical protein
MKKGVSDLVVILTLVAIAIPVSLVLQSWLTSQASRTAANSVMPELEAALVSSKTIGSDQIYVVRLRNVGDRTFDLSTMKTKLVLSDGTVTTATAQNLTSETVLAPGESAEYAISYSGTNKVVSIVFELVDSQGNTFVTQVGVS